MKQIEGVDAYFIHGDEENAVVVINPALGVRAYHYVAFARRLAQFGLVVIVHEYRGNGISPLRADRRTDFGYSELVADLGKLAGYAREHYPELPLTLLGHSLGGHLLLLYSARFPAQIQHLCLVAAGSPCYRGFGGLRRLQVRLATLLIPLISAVIGYFPGRLLGFGGREARTLMSEWSHLARSNRFVLAGEDQTEALAQCAAPITVFGFAGDQFAPRRATELLLEPCLLEPCLLEPCRADIDWRWQQAGELSGLNHFSWLQSEAFCDLLGSHLSAVPVERTAKPADQAAPDPV